MNSKCRRDICTLVITPAFSTIAKTQHELKCPPLDRSPDRPPSYFHIFFLGHAQLFPVVHTDFYEAITAIQNSNSKKMQPLGPAFSPYVNLHMKTKQASNLVCPSTQHFKGNMDLKIKPNII